jgi:glycosyltransferase involved in cell wall biosynthesis
MDISVVVPCYNEEKNLKAFSQELYDVLLSTKRNFEVILIDDGSKDNTWEELKDISKKLKGFKAIRHMRNYGQTAAYQAGFDATKGDYVLTLSSDNETPAQEILKVIEKLDGGFDMVNTNRGERYKESPGSSIFKRIPSIIANKIINKMSNLTIKDTGSGLKGFKRILISNMRLYGDMHRFLPAYCSMFGARICEIDVAFKPRSYGKSAYGGVGLSRTARVFLDLIALKFLLSFSTKPFTMMPIRFFGGLGFVAIFFGLVFSAILSFEKVILGQHIGSRPLLLLAVLLIILGIQFISLGLIGELVLRIYYESQNKKTYIVREIA